MAARIGATRISLMSLLHSSVELLERINTLVSSDSVSLLVSSSRDVVFWVLLVMFGIDEALVK